MLMILIPSVATERASNKFVFTHFNAENGDGINSRPCMFLLGLLMSQYTLSGYDASAHMVNIFYTFLTFNVVNCKRVNIGRHLFFVPLLYHPHVAGTFL